MATRSKCSQIFLHLSFTLKKVPTEYQVGHSAVPILQKGLAYVALLSHAREDQVAGARASTSQKR